MPSKDFNMSYDKISWFTKNVTTARAYGRYVHKLLTGRPLKLINVMSISFHNFIQDTLMEMYSTSNFMDTLGERMEYLAPLGLPDINTQTRFLQKRFSHIKFNHIEDFKTTGAFIGQKSRVSVMELDRSLIKLLRRLFTQHGFDGYIAPSAWPSHYHKMFHDEICLFNMNTCNLIYDHNNLVLSQRGGEVYLGQIDTGKAMDDNALEIKVMRTMGYDGPISYDTNGNVIPYSYEWIKSYKRQQNLVDTVVNKASGEKSARQKTKPKC